MSDLAELQKRLKEAIGRDRELDAELWMRLYIDGEIYGRMVKDWRSVGEGNVHITTECGCEYKEVQSARFTSSIDAALGLVEKMGFCVHMLHMGPEGSQGGASVDLCPPNKADENYEGEGRTPPLAILAALLSAIRQPKEDGGR